MIEPIGGTIFQIFLFVASNVFLDIPKNWKVIFLFGFGLGVMNQGGGFHSASNMFKNDLETVMNFHNDDVIQNLHYYMRVVWEHEVSHYLYASGYAVIAFCLLWSYRNHVGIDYDGEEPPHIDLDDDNIVVLQLNPLSLSACYFSAVIYAFLITAIAADFPSGIIVGLCYSFLYGICGIFGVLLFDMYYHPGYYSQLDIADKTRKNGNDDQLMVVNRTNISLSWSKIHRWARRRLVVYYYLVSYSLAFLLILIVIAISGGVKSSLTG